MPAIVTGSQRPELRFWGWGLASEHLEAAEEQRLRHMVAMLSAASCAAAPVPKVEDFVLPEPTVTVPASLRDIVSTSPYDRLVHAYGKSYADCVRMLLRKVPPTPSLVAFPRSEQDISDLLDWAARANVAVVPFGGGTSVCGGVEADPGEDYAAVLSLDLQYLNRVLEIDAISRAARIQAGALGPEIEAALRPAGLTLRHFPQSFVFSTLGGWIATRSGGHYATVYTHIDDFVESLRMVTPRGTIETRRLPGSGAGPAPDRLLIGSEGSLGVITEGWMRLQRRPRFRSSASVTFATLSQACSAVRAIAQSALFPSNCRLLDAAEAQLNGVGNQPVLVLGFESADHPVEESQARALEICRDHAGTPAPGGGATERRDAASDAWRSAFLRMPYYRNFLTPFGVIADTFETAVTWDRFEAFYQGVMAQVGRAIRETCGHAPVLSCRFTHVYPDGPAPYFTFFAAGTTSGDLRAALARWRVIKAAASDAVVAHGGTITHHHAVGRDHRPGYEREMPILIREALAACKAELDPHGVLNPGVLIDPRGRPVGVRGAMAPEAG